MALLGELEQILTRLDDAGIRHLSIAPAGHSGAAGTDSAEAGDAVPDQASAHEYPRIPSRVSRSLPTDASRPSAPQPHSAAQGEAGHALSSGPTTLEELQFAFRDCTACKLGKTRKRLVFGIGAARPPLLFIGEGPGAEEDQQGLPFVGRAGALLTGFIAALGLTRDDVYITNVVKCRPPGNRTPEPDEIASCRPILLRQIELLDPRLIVTLGNVPLKALQPEAAGITKERGRTFTFGRWTVLPTFHPSYLLRNRSAIPMCWLDFRRAFREAYGSF